jgi:hypothetical protein
MPELQSLEGELKKNEDELKEKDIEIARFRGLPAQPKEECRL